MTKVSDIAAALDVEREELDLLNGHSPEDLGRLLAAIKAAVSREDQRVEQGIEKTLGVVPRPLRGRARVMLFPKEA